MKQFYSTILLFIVAITSFAHDVEIDGIYYDLNQVVKEATVTGYAYSGSVVTIPTTITVDNTTYSVTTIGDYAFSYCFDITSINIPNSVTTIGNSAFSGCYDLTSINIPNSVTTIGDDAFSYCYDLTSINIPNSVTTIGNDAFSYCYDLTSINIPNSVTSIGDNAFRDCSSLTSVTVDEKNSYYSSENNVIYTKDKSTLVYCMSSMKGNFTIPNSVTTIGDNAFRDCYYLTSIYIPNSVTTIGNSAFSDCLNLTSISIGNSVTTIGDDAFFACSSLTSVTIGNSIWSVGRCAFASCGNLETVTCLAEIVPSTETDAFRGSYVNYSTLYVPTASLDAYKSTAPWSDFGQILPINETAAISTTRYESETSQLYSLDGKPTTKPSPNQMVIIRKGNKTIKTIVK